MLFISDARAVIAQQINIEPHDILIPDNSHFISFQWKASIFWIQTLRHKAYPAIPSFKLCKFTCKRKGQFQSSKYCKTCTERKKRTLKRGGGGGGGVGVGD